MNLSRRTSIGFILIIAAMLLTAVLYVSAQPDDARPEFPTSNATKIASRVPLTQTASPAPMLTSTVIPIASDIPASPIAQARCGGPPVMNILVIGSDSRADGYLYGIADAIRLMRVDFVSLRISILDFPRDLWVEIPEIKDNLNQDHGRLSHAYLYGNPGFGYSSLSDQGPGLLMQTLNLNLGMQADSYIAVNMNTFAKIINAVNGIDLELTETVDGRTTDDPSQRLFFPAGAHHLDGVQALTLARIPSAEPNVSNKNQNRVLCALRDKFSSPSVVPQIPELIASFRLDAQNNFSLEQINQLACLATQMPQDNITFASFPNELFKREQIDSPTYKKKISILTADLNILRDYVQRFQSGEWLAENSSGNDAAESGLDHCP